MSHPPAASVRASSQHVLAEKFGPSLFGALAGHALLVLTLFWLVQNTRMFHRPPPVQSGATLVAQAFEARMAHVRWTECALNLAAPPKSTLADQIPSSMRIPSNDPPSEITFPPQNTNPPDSQAPIPALAAKLEIPPPKPVEPEKPAPVPPKPKPAAPKPNPAPPAPKVSAPLKLTPAPSPSPTKPAAREVKLRAIAPAPSSLTKPLPPGPKLTPAPTPVQVTPVKPAPTPPAPEPIRPSIVAPLTPQPIHPQPVNPSAVAIRPSPIGGQTGSGMSSSSPSISSPGTGAGGVGLGNGSGIFRGSGVPGGSSTGGGASEIATYHAQVKSEYTSRWLQPKVNNSVFQKLRVKTEIVIAQDGRVISARIIQSSGHAQLDQSVAQALDSVQRLPPLPASLQASSYAVTLNFDL